MEKTWVPFAACMMTAGGALAQSPPAEPAAPPLTPQTVESIVVQGRFLDTGAQSAMKLDVPVRDTPFAVTSYSEAFLAAINTTSLSDMFKYMTGVARAGSAGADINMRGFSMTAEDRNATLVNGLPGTPGRFSSPPTVAIDHIELVKGPSSVLYGVAQPGGFVNIISKRPEATRVGTVEVRGFTYSGGGLSLSDRTGGSGSIDLTGPIGDGKLLYRAIGEYLHQDLFRNGTYEHSSYLAPSLTWEPTRGSNVTVLGEFRKSDKAYDLGLVAPLNDAGLVPSFRTRYQQPGDYRNEEAKAVSVLADADITPILKWNFGLREVKHHDDAKGFDQTAFITSGVALDGVPCTPDAPCLRMRARGQHNEREWSSFDNNLTLTTTTFGIGHRALFGISGTREVANFLRKQFSNGRASCPTPTAANCLTEDIYNPVALPALDTLPIGPLNNQVTYSWSEGAYASDLLTFTEQWKAMVGARYAYERQQIYDPTFNTIPTQYKTTRKGLPMGGLIYHPTEELTFYTSYSESYVPVRPEAQNEQGLNPFVPETAKQVEAGTKFERGRTQATLAVFQIDKRNVVQTYGCVLGSCTLQIGKVTSKGIELEVNLRPLDNFQVAAGYAYTDATVKDSIDPLTVGSRLVNVPKNSVHLWSRYDFSDALKGLGVGLGVGYIGERFGTLRSTAAPKVLDLAAYTNVDLGIYYVWDRFAATLKVNNLFDKRYLESAGFEAGPLQMTPGAPRNIQLSLRAHF